jgi:hypothetical protein
MVAATLAGASMTNETASAVVMCSITILSVGNFATSGLSVRVINSASRSKMSTLGSVTSPWTSSGMPTSLMASSADETLSKSVTPESEFVVAPAGYSFTAATWPEAAAKRISSADVLSVI